MAQNSAPRRFLLHGRREKRFSACDAERNPEEKGDGSLVQLSLRRTDQRLLWEDIRMGRKLETWHPFDVVLWEFQTKMVCTEVRAERNSSGH